MKLQQRTNSQQSAVHGRLCSFALGLLLFTFSQVEAQQIYRWVDEKGVIHYSHQPPLGKAPTSLDALPPAEPTQQSAASQPANLDSPLFSKGLLWQVQTFGQQATAPFSYIFGTIHSEDPRVLQLPSQIQHALAQSKNFCMEFLPDMGNTAILTKSMVYTDGQNLQAVIGQPLFEQLLPLMSKRGIPAQAFMLFKPWAVYITLSMPQPKTGMFLDLLLYETAKRQGKSVCGLETVEEQVDVFAKTALDDQRLLLRQLVSNPQVTEEQVARMIPKYLERDLAGLVAMSAEQPLATDQEKQIAEAFLKRLVDERNLKMVERMVPKFSEGSTFIAVGALHLPGQQGILQLLANQGHTVLPVY
jgi:uncharacterized protein YbaP (TraB family)